MPLLCGRALTLPDQLLETVLADRFVEREPRFPVGLVFQFERPDQTLVDQRLDPLQDVEIRRLRTYGLGRLDRETAREDGERPKQRLFLDCEQVVRPTDGIA